MITFRKYCDALVRIPNYVTFRIRGIREQYPDEEVLHLMAADTAADSSWELIPHSTWLGFKNLTATYVQRCVTDAHLYRVRQAFVPSQTVTTCGQFVWPEPVEKVLCAFQGLAFVRARSNIFKVEPHRVTFNDMSIWGQADMFCESDTVVNIYTTYEACYFLVDRRMRFAWIWACVTS
jgi:hypothetical protein